MKSADNPPVYDRVGTVRTDVTDGITRGIPKSVYSGGKVPMAPGPSSPHQAIQFMDVVVKPTVCDRADRVGPPIAGRVTLSLRSSSDR
jgi:hypothetical protein